MGDLRGVEMCAAIPMPNMGPEAVSLFEISFSCFHVIKNFFFCAPETSLINKVYCIVDCNVIDTAMLCLAGKKEHNLSMN